MRMSDEAEQSVAGVNGRVRRRRRRWSEARKRQIVAESYQPGISVSVVARRHDVNANQVFKWRRQYRELARVVGGFVPVVVSSTEGAEPAKLLPAPPDIEPEPSGRIEIELGSGAEARSSPISPLPIKTTPLRTLSPQRRAYLPLRSSADASPEEDPQHRDRGGEVGLQPRDGLPLCPRSLSCRAAGGATWAP